jgi:NAD(P)-dependent dehydrogenase (short-subunit alcohol dehydrogenase family)
MHLKDKIIVITGAAKGIGRALAMRFAKEKPRALVLADLDLGGAEQAALECCGFVIQTDVGNEPDVRRLVERTEALFGPIDLFCANAGVFIAGSFDTPDGDWDSIWRVNVLSHIYTARAVVPRMLARGSGYLLHTISAAGLLTAPGSAPYAVTKHAALAFAEHLAIAHGDRGLKVSCLCPQFVLTDMVTQAEASPAMKEWMLAGSISPQAVAECVVEGLAEEKFLILPHAEVAEYFLRKANDYDRWLSGMRRLLARF